VWDVAGRGSLISFEKAQQPSTGWELKLSTEERETGYQKTELGSPGDPNNTGRKLSNRRPERKESVLLNKKEKMRTLMRGTPYTGLRKGKGPCRTRGHAIYGGLRSEKRAYSSWREGKNFHLPQGGGKSQ